MSDAPKPAAVIVRRTLVVGMVAGATYFALQGGEYGTLDLLDQRTRTSELEQRVARLQHEVDSLDAQRKSILTDRTVQERIAREEFGMVRGDDEILYRFADAPAAVTEASNDP